MHGIKRTPHHTLYLFHSHAPSMPSPLPMRLASVLTTLFVIIIATFIPANAQFAIKLANDVTTFDDTNFGVGKPMEINFTVTGGDIGALPTPPSPRGNSHASQGLLRD